MLYEIRLGVEGREMGVGKIFMWEEDTQKIENKKYPTRHLDAVQKEENLVKQSKNQHPVKVCQPPS